MKIAHLSDPHFGTILPGVEEGLLATLADLRPDAILITGDITQRARASQFRAARRFTEKLAPVPFIAVPGNHDIPLLNVFARLLDPYRGFKRLFKDQLEKDIQRGDALVLGLNSTSRWRHVQGAFDLPRLERRLGRAPRTGGLRVAAFHHPVDCRLPQDEKNLLVGREHAVPMLARHGIDLIVGGHIHDPYVTLSGVRYPGIERTMVIAVAGTCLSRRTRKGAPNSFNWMEIEPSRLKITRYDKRADHAFTPERAHAFARIPQGWAPAD